MEVLSPSVVVIPDDNAATAVDSALEGFASFPSLSIVLNDMSDKRAIG